MSALGKTAGQVAKECLRTAQLSGLKWSHRRSDDGDVQWLCWM